MVTSTDATAQLVQLGQAEFVGSMHDNRVCSRDINAGFDNRCA